MAGSERSGIDAAMAELFVGAPWVLTRTATTTEQALSAVESIVRTVGAVPRLCDPATHDEIVASLSHLPHILAYGLAQTAGDLVDGQWLDLAAGSFRDGTRVAASAPDLWADILMDNRESVLRALESNLDWLAQIAQALRLEDGETLNAMLRAARERRQIFPERRLESEDKNGG